MNKKTVDAVMNGQYQLLFISPEAPLESRRWRDILNCYGCLPIVTLQSLQE